MLGSPTQKQRYICTSCNHSWTDWVLDVAIPCPVCGSHYTFYQTPAILKQLDLAIKDLVTPYQTTIIQAYGKEFVFTVPLGDHTPIMDDEAKECVLMVGEDIYSPEVDILEQAF